MTNQTRWGATLALVMMALGASAQSPGITGVERRTTTAGATEIAIVGTDLTAPVRVRTRDASTHIYEFSGHLRTQRSRFTVNSGGVEFVSYGWYSARPPKVRVLLKVNANVESEAVSRDGQWVIVVNRKAATAPATNATANPGTRSDVLPAVGAPRPANPQPTPATKPANQKTEPAKTNVRGENVFGTSVWDMPAAPTRPATTPAGEVKPAPRTVNEQTPVRTETKPTQTSKPTPTTPVNQAPATTPAVKPTAQPVAQPTQTPAQTPASNPLRTQTGAATDTIRDPQRAAGATSVVSLDFVQTDIVQILKALAIQSNVNIVVAPEVSPADKPVRLTVTLNKVSLDDALSVITAMSNLRYGKVGSTYIVTPTAQFAQAVQNIASRSGQELETRVVNLVSGEGERIKEATLKAIPQDGRSGYYQILIPGVDQMPAGAPAPAPAAGQEGQAPQAAPASSGQPTLRRAGYLMVIGDPTRIDAIVGYVRRLDEDIARTLSRTDDRGTVVVGVQSGESGKIREMLVRLVAEHPRAAEFTITESVLEGTTRGEAATVAIMMVGPKSEMSWLETWAKDLDRKMCQVQGKTYQENIEGLEKNWEIVELKFVEPTILELDIKTRFRGVQVSLFPDPVTPGLGGSTSSNTQEQAGGADSGANSGGGQAQTSGGTGAGGSGESGGSSQSESRSITGREPMRLALRGTRQQIDEVLRYISMVDQPARQVALELRVMELTREEAMKLGLDWNLVTGGRLTNIRVNQGAGDTAANPGTISGSYQFQDTDTLNALISLDSSNNGRRLIARPNTLVSDGRSTDLFVGDTIRYIKSIQSNQNGVTVETDSINVGVTFTIKARIGGDGNIALDLDQNFSILTSFLPVPGGGNLPQTSDRRTKMFVNMKSGETLAIGGLILDQDRKRFSGIPVLKDLPIIGRFFSRTDNSRVRNEIVFFLTAVSVNDQNRANAANPARSAAATPDPLGEYERSRGIKKPGGTR